MVRKNIFQLVEENYNVQDEIKKINKLFFDENYFSLGLAEMSLYDIVKGYLFDDWKYRGTCIDIKEYLERVEAVLPVKGEIDESTIVNLLEVLENFIKLYNDNGDELNETYSIQYYTELETVFYSLVETLEKRMGLSKRTYKDRVVLYPKNAPLDAVLNSLQDEDVQWELIRYAREDMTLAEKRKSLAYLATNLYIEDDKKETDTTIKAIIEKAGNILNNLHIRHNNKTGKWENLALKDITTREAVMLCDMVFNEMLTIVLLREHKQYTQTYQAFKKKQKEAKSKNQNEVKEND